MSFLRGDVFNVLINVLKTSPGSTSLTVSGHRGKKIGKFGTRFLVKERGVRTQLLGGTSLLDCFSTR